LRGRAWEAIVHTAADTRWTLPAAEATRANVAPVQALRPLVGPGTRVVHVSTAFAVGLRGEGASTELADYRNTYEWSKARGERIARESFARLTIVRPPLVVGRRSDGRAARFAGMYTILRAISASMVPAIVGVEGAPFEVVPVDDLAAILVEHALGTGGGTLTVAGGARALRVSEALATITDALNAWRARHALEPLRAPRLMSPDSWERFFVPFAREHLTARQRHVLTLLDNFRPYLALPAPLHPTHVVTDLGPCIARAVEFWAQANARLASLPLRPWRAAA
jgi:nucleoside-diphosphate-sugar epimerase